MNCAAPKRILETIRYISRKRWVQARRLEGLGISLASLAGVSIALLLHYLISDYIVFAFTVGTAALLFHIRAITKDIRNMADEGLRYREALSVKRFFQIVSVSMVAIGIVASGVAALLEFTSFGTIFSYFAATDFWIIAAENYMGAVSVLTWTSNIVEEHETTKPPTDQEPTKRFPRPWMFHIFYRIVAIDAIVGTIIVLRYYFFVFLSSVYAYPIICGMIVFALLAFYSMMRQARQATFAETTSLDAKKQMV